MSSRDEWSPAFEAEGIDGMRVQMGRRSATSLVAAAREEPCLINEARRHRCESMGV